MRDILSILPIMVLLFCLLVFKMTAGKSGALSLLTALASAIIFFGMDAFGMTIALSKGMALALYILLIIWAAIFLYNLINEFKAIEVINKNIVIFIKDPFIQFLLLSWLFSSMLQGIAGFGVPVVIVVPILVHLGFEPLISAAAVLLGHSWSVSFGSMGSSFFTIYLVTKLPQQSLGYYMVLFDFIAMLLMGVSVCYIYGGFKYVKKGLVYILPTSIVMICIMTLAIYFNMLSLVGLIGALSGLITMYCIYLFKEKLRITKKIYKGDLTLVQALMPYILIIVLSLLLQFLKLDKYHLAFKYSDFTTKLGYVVMQEDAYAKIKLFGHPAPIILFSAIIGVFIYKKAGIWNRGVFLDVVNKTIDKCVPTSISLVFLITMALVMMDSGMTHQLALSVSEITGKYYPLFAPFFGILGSFITGSNTNSNVIFGKFQLSVAEALGASGGMMAGIQSISGSIGVSLGPTNILIASTATKLTGQESKIYRKVMGSVFLTALVMGIVNYILLMVF